MLVHNGKQIWMRAVWSFDRRGEGIWWDGLASWLAVSLCIVTSIWMTDRTMQCQKASGEHDTAPASLLLDRVAYGQGFLGVWSELSSPFRDCIDIDEETADFLQWLVMPLVVLYFMRMMSVLDRHCECASCLSLAQKTESQITTDFSGGLMTNLHFTSLRPLIWRFPNMSYY